MGPEQFNRPQEVDHRADIYSLGVVFYQMHTGELPTGKFAPPSKKVQIDVRLDEVVLRALEKEPDRRYQQVGELKTRVETIVTTLNEEANSEGWSIRVEPGRGGGSTHIGRNGLRSLGATSAPLGRRGFPRFARWPVDRKVAAGRDRVGGHFASSVERPAVVEA